MEISMPKKNLKFTILPFILICTGAISLIVSVVYTSLIPAFIGLGLLFWGAILIYIKNDKYVEDTLLYATAFSPLISIEQILGELDIQGRGYHLSPKYLKKLDSNKVYISKTKDDQLPKPEQIQEKENQLIIDNPQGILLTSPGDGLLKLFEKKLGTSFIKVDLRYLKQEMPKLLVEELEIAQDMELIENNGTIRMRVTNSPFIRLNQETSTLPRLHEALGCALTSAVASAIARTTGKPTLIISQKIDETANTLTTDFRTIED